MIIRILSYNIHKGIGGTDRKYRLERIRKVIAYYNPDITLLQEVDQGVPRSRGDDQTIQLAQDLNFEYTAFQPNVRLKTGCYGNAILSHFPILHRSDIDLTIPPKKRRRALSVTVSFRKGDQKASVRLVNVHLGLAAFERKIQIKRLTKIEANRHTRVHTPLIIAGDFNDLWENLCKKYFYAQEYSSALGKSKTYPAVYPYRALDRVFYKGSIELSNAFVGRYKLTRSASDHLPIIADFKLVP